MNLLDTASLVVTPNGYKASKLYSIIPSDGTGDMTFARTGDTATRVNSSGLIETVLANKPRLDYTDSTCPKLLLEPQRTNLILQSQDISSASWTKTNSPTIVSNVAVAPDGTTTADSIQSTDANNFKFIYQSFSVSANSTYTLSTFIKKETTRTNYGGLVFYFSGGTAKLVYVAFNEVSGIATNLTDSNITPVIKVDDYGTYWRLSVTATDTGSNISLTAYYYATISTNGTSTATAAGSARTIWGMQLEAGAYATSYIPTTTAGVTRNADSLNKTGISSLIGQTEGTFFVDFNVINTNDSIFYQLSNTIGANSYIDSIYMFQNGTNYFDIVSRLTAGIQASFRISSLTVGRHKVAIGYKANDFVAYVDGILVGTDTSGTLGTYNVLDLNGTDISAQLDYINSSALWKTRLQNSELATLTSL